MNRLRAFRLILERNLYCEVLSILASPEYRQPAGNRGSRPEEVFILIARKDSSREILLPILKEMYKMNRLPDIFEEAFDEVLKVRDTKSESKDARSILIMLCDKRLGDPSPEVVSRLEKIKSIKELHALTGF